MPSSRATPPSTGAAATTTSRRDLVVAGVALVAVALSLRTTVSSLPPLLADVRQDIPLSGGAAGLLTALPVLCMAWLAPAAARGVTRFGSWRTTLLSVLLVAAGNALRGLGSSAGALLAATLVAGAGVALLGIVLPAVVKSTFHGFQGAATGGYTVAMMGGSVLAASTSAPLATALGSWRAALAAWAVPAAVAAAVWLLAGPRPAPSATAASRPHRLPWSSRPAWELSAFMTAQSSLAYAFIAWLAPSYVERGWTSTAAGSLFGVVALAQLVSSLVLPALADTVVEFRTLTVAAVSLTVVGTFWFWQLPTTLPWVAAVVLGLGNGAGFALGLTRIVHYAADAQASSALTALVFVTSYTVTAVVPVAIGVVHDATGGFAVPFGLLFLVAVVQLVLAGRLHGRYRGQVT